MPGRVLSFEWGEVLANSLPTLHPTPLYSLSRGREVQIES